MNRWELEKKIVMKALKDPEFKKKLLSHPKEALQEILKTEKKTDFSHLEQAKIKTYEEKKDEWMIAIPYLGQQSESLSERELEKLFAAGGITGTTCLSIVNCPS